MHCTAEIPNVMRNIPEHCEYMHITFKASSPHPSHLITTSYRTLNHHPPGFPGCWPRPSEQMSFVQSVCGRPSWGSPVGIPSLSGNNLRHQPTASNLDDVRVVLSNMGKCRDFVVRRDSITYSSTCSETTRTPTVTATSSFQQ